MSLTTLATGEQLPMLLIAFVIAFGIKWLDIAARPACPGCGAKPKGIRGFSHCPSCGRALPWGSSR